MKCYLENVGVLSSDNIINVQQAVLHFTTNEDLINSCVVEQSEIGIDDFLQQILPTENLNRKIFLQTA